MAVAVEQVGRRRGRQLVFPAEGGGGDGRGRRGDVGRGAAARTRAQSPPLHVVRV